MSIKENNAYQSPCISVVTVNSCNSMLSGSTTDYDYKDGWGQGGSGGTSSDYRVRPL